MFLVLVEPESGQEMWVPLEDCGLGPGLGQVRVKVVDDQGQEVVRPHPYHFDVRRPDTMDLERRYEEPEELPDLPAYLDVEPYQR